MEDTGGQAICPQCAWRVGVSGVNTIYLAPGTVLREQYLVGKVLGHGGFGITYLGWDLHLARKIAIKEYFPNGIGLRPGTTEVYPISASRNEDYKWGLERFIDEARVVARFENHPNIIWVQNFFSANGTAYIILEFLDGMTFEEYLKAHGGRVDWMTAARVMTPVMDALREVHRSNLLHRDISPDNIYLLRSGLVKVIDFGAARYSMGQHSQNLSVILKPGYAPPEQYQSRGNQGPWTDVYACAGTFYRAVTGQVPAAAPDRMAGEEIAPPSRFGVAIPEGAERALGQALSLRAEQRFATMAEFQQAILGRPAGTAAPTGAPAGAPLPAMTPAMTTPPTTVPVPPVPPPPRPKWPWVLVGLMALAVGGLGLSLLGKKDPAPEVKYFRASPAAVAPGEGTTLAWAVTPGSRVEIEGLGVQPVTGSVMVAPGSSTTYVLRVEKDEQKIEQRLEVTVNPRLAGAAEIRRFEVIPNNVAPNQAARLYWEVQKASEVRIGDATLPASGETEVKATESTRYTLRARGPDGSVKESSVVLLVGQTAPPPARPTITTFRFQPPVIERGQATVLSWSVEGATKVTVNGKPAQTSGEVRAMPQKGGTATIEATGPGGTVSGAATLTVNEPRQQQQQQQQEQKKTDPVPTGEGPRVVSFRANQTALQAGGTAMLSWEIAGATRASIEPGVGALQRSVGSMAVTPRSSTRYVLTAEDNAGRRVTQAIDIEVQAPRLNPVRGTSWQMQHIHWMPTTNTGQVETCAGVLVLEGTMLRFQSQNSNDGFQVQLAQIEEVKANRLRVAGYRAFHVKLKNGRNYNFVPRDPVDAIVESINLAMR